jgi:hypothetical protein
MTKTIDFYGTKKGVITVTKLNDPYGDGIAEVASIGVSLDNENEHPEWKVHIPLENIDEVIEALKELKK